MIMRLILWLSVLWIAPLVVGVLVNDAKFKKNLAVGVTIPPEFQADPDIAAHLARFRRQEWTLCIILVLAAVPCIFVQDFGRNMTLWSVWLLLVCVLPYAPYARCNLALKRLKAERGWRRETAPCTETVDLSAIPSYRWLSPWLFALPFAVSLLPLLWSAENWIVLLTDAGCVVLFWLCYRFCYRKKSERVDENAELAKVLSQVRLHRWGRLWLVSAWMMAALNLIFSLAEPNSVLELCAFGAVMLLHITYLLYTEFRLRALQAKLTAGAATGALVDEDDRWIFGQFYYNPDDRHLIVNARTGLNTTVNLARPAGRIFMGFAALCLLGMLAIGPWMSSLDTRPVTLTATETELISTYGTKETRIPRAEITDVTLLDELPDGLSRTNGTSMEHLAYGRYFSRVYGGIDLCLDPTEPPFLLISTAEKTYLLASREAEQTREVAEALEVEIPR